MSKLDDASPPRPVPGGRAMRGPRPDRYDAYSRGVASEDDLFRRSTIVGWLRQEADTWGRDSDERDVLILYADVLEKGDSDGE